MQKQRLQDVLSGPEKWTVEEYARRSNGAAVTLGGCVRGARADCYCLIGAVAFLLGPYRPAHLIHDEADARLKQTIFAAGFGTVERVDCWNDDPARTFDDIRKVAVKYDEMYPVEA